MQQDSTVEATRSVVAELNRAHGLTFALHSRCPSGLQEGAWRLTDAEGRPAILKWRPGGSAAQLRHQAHIVARLRAGGYPTPAWLAVGATPDGNAYYLQDFAPGMPSHPLTASVVGMFVAMLERHAGLDPDPDQDRNEHVRFMALDESDGGPRRTVRRLGPAGDVLIARYVALLDRYRGVALPGGDLVHGDFNTCNVLLRDGRVSGVIDIEALGSGTRVIDYACLLRESYVDGYSTSVRTTLRRAAEAIAGPGVLAVCAAATAFDIVGFKLRHDPSHIRRTLDRLGRLAHDLAGGAGGHG